MNQQKDNTTTHHLTEFQPYLDDVDIPDDQKEAFLELIWSIMVEFAALGFGADATSQAIASHLAESLKEDAPACKSQPRLTATFADCQPNNKTKNDCEARI